MMNNKTRQRRINRATTSYQGKLLNRFPTQQQAFLGVIATPLTSGTSTGHMTTTHGRSGGWTNWLTR
jgi:hypothetical protein